MGNKLVTILAVVYNQYKYIDDFMYSALNQSYENIEIIIADDCSTDGSYEKVMGWKEQLEARFVQATIIQTPHNMGIVGNINNALPYVNGEYFKWIACDDVLLPSAVEDLLEYLENNPEYGMVYSNYYQCTERDNYEKFILQQHEVHKSKVIAEQEQYAQALYENDFIVAPTVMVRWNIVNEPGFFDEDIGVEDWGAWIEIALKHKIGYLDKVTAAYRVVENSLSHFTPDEAGRTRLKNMVVNEIKILDKYKNCPKIKPERGIFACCEQAISIAIDLEAKDVIELTRQYAKKNKVSFSFEIKIKYLLYSLHLWSGVTRIRHSMGGK